MQQQGKLLPNLQHCQRCPRLVAHREEVIATYPHYVQHPIGAWGPQRYHLLIVGLAPGLHGAARTGKAFVGDASGQFLFSALHKAGFATNPNPQEAKLVNTRITNASATKHLNPRTLKKGEHYWPPISLWSNIVHLRFHFQNLQKLELYILQGFFFVL